MANLEKFNDLVRDYSKLVDFALIYIEEAHPTDGWHLKSHKIEIESHKSSEARLDAAQKLMDLEAPPCPVIVDSMSNHLNTAYAALPERLFIVEDGIVVYEGGVGPFDYKMSEVKEWLEGYTRKHK